MSIATPCMVSRRLKLWQNPWVISYGFGYTSPGPPTKRRFNATMSLASDDLLAPIAPLDGLRGASADRIIFHDSMPLPTYVQ